MHGPRPPQLLALARAPVEHSVTSATKTTPPLDLTDSDSTTGTSTPPTTMRRRAVMKLLILTGLAFACAAPREPGPAAATSATAPPTAPPIAGPSARAPVARPLAVTYLANEGLLLSAAGEAVLIDGLHRPYQPEYAVLEPDARALVERAAAEYAAVRLVLVSHHHRDHFDAEAVRDHLLHNVRSRLISSPQVVDAVLAAPGAEGLRARSEALPWAPGVRHRRRVDSVTVEFIGMSHGEGRHRDVPVLGGCELRADPAVTCPSLGRPPISR